MTIDRTCDLMARILQRDVDPTLTLDEEGGVTALDIARLAIAAEHAFGINLMDERIAGWKTLADAAEYIEELMDAGEAGKAIKEDNERTGWYYGGAQ